MLQTLHHHPHPKETQNYRTKWLQACGSNVCGHEVIWKTGAGLPEGHHWTLAGSSSVCLKSKLVCGRCSQHGTALCSATSRQTRGLCEDPICGHYPQHYDSKPPPAQTNSALHAHLHLSVDQQLLTDRQQLVRLVKYSSSTRMISTGAPQGCVLSPLLFSLYTNDCTSKDPSVKLLLKFGRRYYTDRPHPGRWWVCLQTGGWAAGCLVQVLTTWSWTRSKQWRWSWTSGETRLLSAHSPSWTAL